MLDLPLVNFLQECIVYILNNSRDTVTVDGSFNWLSILAALRKLHADVLLLFACTSPQQARVSKWKFIEILDTMDGPKLQPMHRGVPEDKSKSPHLNFVNGSPTCPFSSEWVNQTSCLDARIISDAAVSRVYYHPDGSPQVYHIVPLWPKARSRETSPPPLPIRPAFFPEYCIEDDLSELDWWRLLERLRDNLPPSKIQSWITVLLQYHAKVYEILFGMANGPDALIVENVLDSQTREELQDLCRDFVRLVPIDPMIKALLKNYDPGIPVPSATTENFIAQRLSGFNRLCYRLVRNMNIALMAGLRSEGKEILQKVAEGQAMIGLSLPNFAKLQKLQIVEPGTKSLPLRLSGDTRSTAQPPNHVSSLTPRRISSLGTVLVEYKKYTRNAADKEAEKEPQASIAALQVQALARALEMPKMGGFLTLKCLGWFNEPDLHRYGLASEFPEGVSGEFQSIHDMMTHPGPQTNPGLGRCFAIALAIGEALQRWHVSGWLHRAISSRNIIFFFSPDGTEVLWEKPYLCGFEYARPGAVPWSGRFVEDFATNVYNHPERQGEPTEQHGKIHDMYSFGVVMCEIAVWTTAESVFANVDKRTLSPMRMRQMMVKYAEESVGYHMGNKYMRSALACLNGSFGVENDDAFDTKLLKAFDKLVLRNLEDGLKVE